MKKIILMLAIALSPLALKAQELTWQTDFNKAIEQSTAAKKPMMLFFTGSDWCGWCMKLQREVFQTPEFIAWANENVILVELDFPRRKEQSDEIKMQNAQLSSALQVRGYPTVWLVSAEKQEDGKMALNALGSTGYVAGGPTAWIATAEPFIKK